MLSHSLTLLSFLLVTVSSNEGITTGNHHSLKHKGTPHTKTLHAFSYSPVSSKDKAELDKIVGDGSAGLKYPKGFFNDPCGDIKLTIYGIQSMKKDLKLLGKKLTLEADKILQVNHLAILVCGLEFHYGYRHLISVCEQSEFQGTAINCTDEIYPQFKFEQKGDELKPVIVRRKHLKFGRIVNNVKPGKSPHKAIKELYDTHGNKMRTNFSLKEIIENVFNNQMRKGQPDFPLVETSEYTDGETKKTKYHVIVNGVEVDAFTLPEEVKDYEAWNKLADKIKKAKGSEHESEIDPAAKALYEKLLKLTIDSEPAVFHDAEEVLGSHPASEEPSEVFSSAENRFYEDMFPGQEAGQFAHGTYSMVYNDCMDFSKSMVEHISNDQVCNWEEGMSHLKLLVPFRFIKEAKKRGVINTAMDYGHNLIRGHGIRGALLGKKTEEN